jgi:hypothetical protein
MAFKDFREFADPLRLPINGKTYEVPPVPARLGIQLLGLAKGDDVPELASLSGMDLWQALLGSAWDEMVADDVPMSAIARAGLVALADYQQGRAVAEVVWEGGIDPERMAAQVAATLKDSTPSTTTDEASSTPTQASTSGTTSRRSTKRTAKPKAEPAASAGSNS